MTYRQDLDKFDNLPDDEEEFDLSKIRTLDELKNVPPEFLYDRTDRETDDIYSVTIRPDVLNDFQKIKSAEDVLWSANGYEPTYEEVADFLNMRESRVRSIEKVYETVTFFSNYTRGIIVISGDEGSGKDLLTYFMGYVYREYFGMTPMIDAKPRDEYGLYVPWSVPFLKEQLKRMNELLNPANNKLADENAWEGIFIKRGFIHLTEFSNWMHRMKQSSPKGRTMAQLLKTFRHLGFCIVGCDADKRSIDPNYCMPRVTCEIQAVQTYESGLFRYIFHPKKYSNSKQQLNSAGYMEILEFRGDEPHPCLNWQRPYDIYNTTGATGYDIPKTL